MKQNKLYIVASISFLILGLLIFFLGGYSFLGVSVIDLFLALMVMAYVTSFIGLMKDRKSIIAWLLLILNSIIVICIIYFLTHFKMKI